MEYGAISLDVYQIEAPGDGITFLATLGEAFDKAVRIELNGTGWGEFSLSRKDASALVAVLQMGNLVKVRWDPFLADAPQFAFFLDEGDFDLISRDEEGGENLRFKGRGALAYWDRAIWLSETFTLPWWPACIVSPAAGAKGAVDVKAGKYRAYTVASGVITGYADFTTAAFCASFDARRTYRWPTEHSKRFLVHLMDGPHSGIYFHPHQDGVTEYLASKSAGFRTGVTLTEVGGSPGAVLNYLAEEVAAAARPVHPMPLMTIDFGPTLDSDGNAWATSDALSGLSAGIGDNYLATLGMLIGTGVIDVAMGPDLDMHAYNSYGTDRTSAVFASGKVLFRKGDNIADALVHQVFDAPVATFAEVKGSNDVFAQVQLPDAYSRVAREVSIDGNSDNATTLEAIGLAELNLRLARGESLEFPIVLADGLLLDELGGYYIPAHPDVGGAGTFWVGDTVTLTTGPTAEDYVEAAVRVTALTLGEDAAGGLTCVPAVQAGDLAITGSIGQNTPDAFTPGDCNCPCDIGTVIEGSDPPIYYGEYTKSLCGTGTGAEASYALPSLAQFVDGSLSVYSLPTGHFLATTFESGLAGRFTTTAPTDDDVYAQYRAACALVAGCGG